MPLAVLIAACIASARPINSRNQLAIVDDADETRQAPSSAARPQYTLKKRAADSHPMAPFTLRYVTTFFHVHTRDLLPATNVVAAEELEQFLRCRATARTNVMAEMPLVIATQMARRFSAKRVLVLSGFRSAKFNESLRKKGRQVASRSQHVLGNALDFKLPGVSPRQLAAAVAEVHHGGIGIYRDTGFVHVDVGPVRSWNGS